MQIAKIYEGLQNQAGTLVGLEQQIEGLLTTNKKNLQSVENLPVANLPAYFKNQHACFNVLFEAVTDLKIMNSYTLFEIEAQLRDDKSEKV